MSVTIYVADLPDFAPLIAALRSAGDVHLIEPVAGYWQIKSDERVSLSRRSLKLRTALWFSMLSGGYRGKLVEFTQDTMTIESEE